MECTLLWEGILYRIKFTNNFTVILYKLDKFFTQRWFLFIIIQVVCHNKVLLSYFPKLISFNYMDTNREYFHHSKNFSNGIEFSVTESIFGHSKSLRSSKASWAYQKSLRSPKTSSVNKKSLWSPKVSWAHQESFWSPKASSVTERFFGHQKYHELTKRVFNHQKHLRPIKDLRPLKGF